MARRPARSSALPPLPDSLTRREALGRCTAAVTAGVAWAALGARVAARPHEPTVDDATAKAAADAAETALDEALSRLLAHEPRAHGGLSSHAPMAMEALVAMGRGERVAAWLDEFESENSLVELPARARPIDREEWRAALGLTAPDATSWNAANGRFADWVALFEEELRDGEWRAVLDRWAPRLAPGYCAAALHGVLRTAHAARALGRRESEPRRRELARGLAYWASSWQELRGVPPSPPPRTLAESLERLPLHRVVCGAAPRGNLVNGIRNAGRLDGFPAAGSIAALDGDTGAAIAAMTATMARAYLRHGTKGQAIGFVHAVTGPAALRKLAPHVSEATLRALLPHAWQASQAIYAAYAGPEREAPPLELAPAEPVDRIVALAADDGDAHVIKLTDALLAEHALHPDPALLAAAADVHRRL